MLKRGRKRVKQRPLAAHGTYAGSKTSHSRAPPVRLDEEVEIWVNENCVLGPAEPKN